MPTTVELFLFWHQCDSIRGACALFGAGGRHGGRALEVWYPPYPAGVPPTYLEAVPSYPEAIFLPRSYPPLPGSVGSCLSQCPCLVGLFSLLV